MNTCEQCRWWLMDNSLWPLPPENEDDEDWDFPMSSEKEQKIYGFRMGRCKSPNLLQFNHPPEAHMATVCDGSNYKAQLHTGPKFGCCNWEAI